MYTATEIYGGIHDIFSVYPKGRVFFFNHQLQVQFIRIYF